MMWRRIARVTLALSISLTAWIPTSAPAQRPNLLARVNSCSIPPVPADAQIVYLGTFRPRAVATVDLASRGITGIADVMIEPGTTPIYLIAGSTVGMILRFSGHVERLTNVVSVAWFGMGFIGIDRKLAAWREGPDCGIRSWDPKAVGFFGPNATKWGTAAEQIEYVETLAGRSIDRKIVEGTFEFIALPSGELLEREHIPGQLKLNIEGGDGFVSDDFLRAYPEGLVEVMPEEVVYSEPVRPLSAVTLRRP